MRVTKKMMKQAMTSKGGYTGAQIRMARTITGKVKGAMKSMVGRELSDREWATFVDLSGKYSAVSNAKRPNTGDWSWRPSDGESQRVASKPQRTSQARAREKKRSGKPKIKDCFYMSREWRAVRAYVLEMNECKCMMCGRSPKRHGVVLHVDHIKPRSKYPHLELDKDNLQILCEDCNLGKGNMFETDWRPEQCTLTDDEVAELELAMAAGQVM